MSLDESMTGDVSISFPRVSGDEPRSILVTTTKIVFSPRERG